MSQVVACPKCQKKYQVAESALGKQLKCPACQTVFIAGNSPPASRAGASRAAQSSAAGTAMRPGADWAKHGLEGPLAPSPELFPPAPPNGPDPLANHVIEDPGFVDVDVEAIRKERVKKERKNRIGEEKDALEEYKRELAEERKKKKELEQRPWNIFKSSLIMTAIYVVLIGIACGIATVDKTGGYVVYYLLYAAGFIGFVIDCLWLSYVYDSDPDSFWLYFWLPPYRMYYWFKHWKAFGWAFLAGLIYFIPMLVHAGLAVYFIRKWNLTTILD